MPSRLSRVFEMQIFQPTVDETKRSVKPSKETRTATKIGNHYSLIPSSDMMLRGYLFLVSFPKPNWGRVCNEKKTINKTEEENKEEKTEGRKNTTKTRAKHSQK